MAGEKYFAKYIISGGKTNTNDMCVALGITDQYLKSAFSTLHNSINDRTTGAIYINTGGPIFWFDLFKLNNNYYSAELFTYNQTYGLSVIKYCYNNGTFYGVKIK